MRVFKLLTLCCLSSLVLAGCTGEPGKRYFPPQLSLQQLQFNNGQWQAQVRLQNFSTGTVVFDQLHFNLQLQEQTAIAMDANESLKVGANNAEILTLNIPLDVTTQQVLQEHLSHSQAVHYRIDGTVHSSTPKNSYPISYQGRLNPAPGLQGVFR